jgi:ribose 5-phosphate isomerase B
MKRFDIITEADARTIDPGTTVAITKDGHVTPLARDTLRERRITVVTDGAPDEDSQRLVPPADVKRIAIGSDHTGVSLKAMLVAYLRAQGRQVDDFGVHAPEPAADYPDIAGRVARAVGRGEADGGIAIDGAGIGSAMAANKVRGVRAAMCPDVTLARYAREHNGANVLTLGATLVTEADARAIVDMWLLTPMREPRYIRRLAIIARLERDER